LEKKDNDFNDYSNLDILFLVPPVFRIMGKKWDSYPLGLGYLVSSLDQKKIKSAIYHANYLEVDECPPNENWVLYLSKQWEKFYSTIEDVDNDIWHEIAHVLEITNPKIVGISSCIVDLPSTYKVANLIKKYNNEIIVIVGGPSATTYSEKLINSPAIDFLVIGEGERTISELIPVLLNKPLNFEKIRAIKGLMYRDRNNVITNEKRDLISNLDDIPFPNREKVFIIDRSKNVKKIYLTSDILLSRGCPFKCKFCSAFTVWGTRKSRSRTNENILEEITHLKCKYNQDFFVFWDDLFSVNKSKVVDLCNKLIQLNLNIKWVCLARLDTVDKELLLLMKRAGCIEIQFGIESGSDRILSYVNKGLTIGQIVEKSKTVRECNIPWRIFLIIGFPTETEQEIFETIQFVDILKPTCVDLSIFAPYPGTELYSELYQLGQISDKSDRCDTSYFEKNYTLNISEERFKEIAIYAFNYIENHNKKMSSSDKRTLMGLFNGIMHKFKGGVS